MKKLYFVFLSVLLLPFTGNTQCNFTIENATFQPACHAARSAVVWKSLVNSTAAGNTLTKSSGGNAWNAGAFSVNQLQDNGILEVVATQTNTDRMIGLSSSDNGSSFNTIRYAVYLKSSGTFEVYENGVSRGGFGGYTSGDVFQLRAQAGRLSYLRNGNIFWVSSDVPSFPLFADASINTQGGVVAQATIISPTDGAFAANVNNPGTGATYQWTVNGNPAGSNSSFNSAGLSQGDLLRCTLIPGSGGCAVTPQLSNELVYQTSTAYPLISSLITSIPVTNACFMAQSVVNWTNLTANMRATGNGALIKGNAGGNWDGGAFSSDSILANGGLGFVSSQTNANLMVGLSATDVNSSYTSLQFAFYLKSNGGLEIYESGISRGGFGNYTTSDTLMIRNNNGVIQYLKNGMVLYVSNVVPAGVLRGDVSFNSINAAISSAFVLQPTAGVFDAKSIQAGSNPGYQWYRNGTPTGNGTSSLVLNNLQAGDQIQCAIQPEWSSCSGQPVLSNLITISSNSSFGGLVYIAPGYSPTACRSAVVEVTPVNLYQVIASGNSVTKIQSGGNWDGGFASPDTVFDGGELVFFAGNTNTDKMCGLSAVAGNNSYTSIQYAFYMQASGNLGIYENGISRGNFGTYSTGDTLKIAIEAGVVKYYRNSTLLYISAQAPSAALIVDGSLKDVGASVVGMKIRNGNTGLFRAVVTGGGNNPSYQWMLNGAPVGLNSSEYSNNHLTAADVLYCVVSPDLAGCGSVTYTSLSAGIRDNIQNPQISFFIAPVLVNSACKSAISNVTLTGLSNVLANGNSISKIQNNGNWDGGFASLDTVFNGGSLSFQAGSTTTNKMCGLSAAPGNNSYTFIQYAFYLTSAGVLSIYENGISRGNFGNYSTSDTLRIAIENNVVKYYRNNVLLFISAQAVSTPLNVDGSLRDTGPGFVNIVVRNGNTGSFRAVATGVGVNPVYQWKLNGQVVGSNSAVYSSNVLSSNDTITCTVFPDLGSCGSFSYTSQAITFRDNTVNPQITFFITPLGSGNACRSANSMISFQSLLNVEATGNNLRKIQSGGNWDGGFASLDSLYNGGVLSFYAGDITTNKMCGLSAVAGNSSYTSIQYAWYMTSAGVLSIYESGLSRGNFGTYTTADTLKIAVEAGVVKYYKNSTLLYISTIAPGLPLIVDGSLRDLNAQLNNIQVRNGSNGIFRAVATGAGNNPAYQWKLNGNNVGTNSSSFTTPVLNTGDVITCVLSPDLGACNSLTYTAQPVWIRDNTVNPQITFYIAPEALNNSCRGAISNVTFKDLTNVSVTGNQVVKIQSGGAWNGGLASLDSVYNGGSLMFKIGSASARLMMGLSASNANDNYTTIRHAFYFQGNGVLGIYENGINRGNFGNYSVNDSFSVAIVANQVKYIRNGTVVYTSTLSSIVPLIADGSLFDVNASLLEVRISNGSSNVFRAVASGAGNNPVYQWKVNGVNTGTNSPVYTNNFLGIGDVLTCEMTPDLGACSNFTYSTSAPITILFNPQNPLNTNSVSIVASTNNVCSGTPVTFTATGVNGGSNPSFTWKVNNQTQNATGNVFTSSSLNNLDTVYCLYTSNASCVAPETSVSNKIVMTLIGGVTPAITISASPGLNVCSNTSVTFSSSITNGGTSPLYEWRRNNVVVGTGPVYTQNSFAPGDVILCKLTNTTSSCLTAATVNSNSLNMNVFNCTQAVSWLGNVNNNWNNAQNWSTGTVPNGCGFDVGILATANNPVLGSNVTVGNLNLSSGASIQTGGFNLSVCGDWSGAGTVTGNGEVIFTSAATQYLEGTTEFNQLTVQRPVSNFLRLKAGSSIKVRTALRLRSGKMATTAGQLVLLSNATQTAFVDDFSSGFTGTLSGNLTVQRFAPAAGTGNRTQHQISTGLSGVSVTASLRTQLALSGTDGLQIIPNGTCTGLAPNSPNSNLQDFVPTAVTSCLLQGYRTRTSGSTVQGAGYLANILNNSTLEYTGTYTGGNITLSTTNTGVAAQNGYNFLGNPYPSAWIYQSQSGFDANGLVYVPTGALAGTYQPLTPGTAVASSQGFWVRRTNPGSGSFVFQNNQRTTGSPVWYRTQFDQSIQLELSHAGFKDQTVIRFDELASAGYDEAFDAGKLLSDPGQPTFFSKIGNEASALNTLKDAQSTSSVELGIIDLEEGESMIHLAAPSTVSGMAVVLEDRVTGRLHDLKTQPDYAFIHFDGERLEDRFVVHFNAEKLAQVVPALQAYANGNTLYIDFSGMDQVDAKIQIYNLQGQLIYSGTHQQQQLWSKAIDVADAGYWMVQVINHGQVLTKKVMLNSGK